MFNLRKELKSRCINIPLTYTVLVAELNQICWDCRKDLEPGIYGRDLFGMAYEKGFIRRAFASDQYGEYYVVTVD